MTGQKFFRYRFNNRKGIIMFVVIGAILVLTLLVTSYNFFVRGKFNESREILKHVRATKCSQSVCKYIFTHLLNDLHDSNEFTSSSGQSLRKIFYECNDQYKLKERFEKEWLNNIDYKGICKSILEGTTGTEGIDCEVEVGFPDINSLDSVRNSKGMSSNVFFFDGEKVGRLTLRVSVKIGKSCGIWQETRPFKVVFPFPVPITKFNFYWKDGPDNAFIFNTISLSSDNCESVNGREPLLFDNGSTKPNTKDNVWVERGWIYVGGNGLTLNRARGDKKYGQRFFSYPRMGEPISLMLNFPNDDGWSNHQYKGETLGFRRAYWGFSDSLTKNSSQNSWRTILKSEYEMFNPDIESNKVYWNSSSLHLFSDMEVSTSNKPKDIVPTITRVIGNVSDRYLEIGYLLPVNSDSDTVDSIFAAVIGLSGEEYKELQKKGKRDISDEKFTFENNLYFSGGYDFESDTDNGWAKAIQSYFNELPYEVDGDSGADYYTVMSKATYRDMDETYDIIAQYSNDDENVNIPPTSSVPKITDLRFLPQNSNFSSKFPSGILPSKVMNMEVPKIADIDDSTFGLSLRTCYEITGESENIGQILRSCFGSKSNSSDLNLNNCVYKLSPNSGSLILKNLNINTPGAIFSKGPITVGNFLTNNKDANNSPLLLLAENGAISIDNGGKSEVRAYLIALGEGGTVKALRKDYPLSIIGGMAVKEFSPDNIPNKGGCLAYNLALDPTKDEFFQYFGVVFGPKGGGL